MTDVGSVRFRCASPNMKSWLGEQFFSVRKGWWFHPLANSFTARESRLKQQKCRQKMSKSSDGLISPSRSISLQNERVVTAFSF